MKKSEAKYNQGKMNIEILKEITKRISVRNEKKEGSYLSSCFAIKNKSIDGGIDLKDLDLKLKRCIEKLIKAIESRCPYGFISVPQNMFDFGSSRLIFSSQHLKHCITTVVQYEESKDVWEVEVMMFYKRLIIEG